MKEERTSILRYWAAGIVYIFLAIIVSAPLTFLSGFFEFLADGYGITFTWIIYSLLYIIFVPYILGRVIKWVSQKILQS